MEKREFKMITLCGSTNFKEQFMEEAQKLTLDNYIVLMPHVFIHRTGMKYDKDVIERFNEMHKKMIDMSDAIMVINKDGYIGESTKSEIEYAKQKGKKVYYMYINCESDCAYNLNCLAKRRLPPFNKKISNKYAECPYHCEEDK